MRIEEEAPHTKTSDFTFFFLHLFPFSLFEAGNLATLRTYFEGTKELRDGNFPSLFSFLDFHLAKMRETTVWTSAQLSSIPIFSVLRHSVPYDFFLPREKIDHG